MSTMAAATYVLVSFFAFAYVIFFVVITVGGFFDLLHLVRGLRTEVVDPADDGRAIPAAPEAGEGKS